jgi:hypothetical protein
MSLSNQMGALTPLSLLNAVDAANTAAATSAYVAVTGYEGQVAVVVDVGVIDDGSLTVTFLTASAGDGTGEASIVPVGGALTAITTSNDVATYVAVFNVSQLLGYLKVVGTKASAGGVLVSYSLIGRKKYLG